MTKVQQGIIKQAEGIHSNHLFASDFYQVVDWRYHLDTSMLPAKKFNDAFCLVYIRQGNFAVDLSVKSHYMPSGYVLLEKPNYEFQMLGCRGECTIINFSDSFYHQLTGELLPSADSFFLKDWLFSLQGKTNPEIDFLHHQLLTQMIHGEKLQMDMLVMELFRSTGRKFIRCFDDLHDESITPYTQAAIEQAKDYMYQNFYLDISLRDVSASSYLSPYHFSRVFKKVTSYSPHQYLQLLRLKHSEVLLKCSELPVADIAYASGFSSTAYFATAFKNKYKLNPVLYRKENAA